MHVGSERRPRCTAKDHVFHATAEANCSRSAHGLPIVAGPGPIIGARQAQENGLIGRFFGYGFSHPGSPDTVFRIRLFASGITGYGFSRPGSPDTVFAPPAFCIRFSGHGFFPAWLGGYGF